MNHILNLLFLIKIFKNNFNLYLSILNRTIFKINFFMMICKIFLTFIK